MCPTIFCAVSARATETQRVNEQTISEQTNGPAATGVAWRNHTRSSEYSSLAPAWRPNSGPRLMGIPILYPSGDHWRGQHGETLSRRAGCAAHRRPKCGNSQKSVRNHDAGAFALAPDADSGHRLVRVLGDTPAGADSSV